MDREKLLDKIVNGIELTPEEEKYLMKNRLLKRTPYKLVIAIEILLYLIMFIFFGLQIATFFLIGLIIANILTAHLD